MTGQGLKFTDVLPGILSAQLRIQHGAPPSGLFPGADFPGHIFFSQLSPDLWITVAPLLREKALLTA